jgi:hypothetical protein
MARKNVFYVPGNPSFPAGLGNYIGFFYHLGAHAVVKNLSFTNVDIQGAANVGALAATANWQASVINVHVLSGSVTGTSGVGALIGANSATLTDCSSSIGPMTGN